CSTRTRRLPPDRDVQPAGARGGGPGPGALPLRGVDRDGGGPHRPRPPVSRTRGGGAVSGLSPTSLLSIVLGYLAFLFLVASVAEAFPPRLARGRVQTLTYVLAASVYCTAWTFYGSVGGGAKRGLGCQDD